MVFNDQQLSQRSRCGTKKRHNSTPARRPNSVRYVYSRQAVSQSQQRNETIGSDTMLEPTFTLQKAHALVEVGTQ